jgi:glycerophosphoryl diester phosphodiesterase
MTPTIVAHRGYAAKYPENTIAACQAAVDAGAKWVEVDVQMLGIVPVLSHDIPAEGQCTSLIDFADWLESNPQVTALVDLKSESLIEYGRLEVVQEVTCIMLGRNWHPISFDYEALRLASVDSAPAPGWIVCEFNQEIVQKAKAIGARWLIMNQIFIPPEGLPAGPFEWMTYEIATPEQARSALARGVTWLETMNYELIRDGLEQGA